MTSTLELVHVTKTYNGVAAVRDVSVSIPKGEFFSFLGPSGCGKTTILRMISGFIAPTRGAIQLDGKDLAGVGPHKRPTALIFQNLALFPLMSVADNIAYGLRVRGASTATQRRKADELLDLIALSGYGEKRIDELSGGQKQRVAIARALAVEPAVLLLDEPLSSLDLKLRQHMRAELRSLQRRTGVTFVYITHDQGEALAMSDRVAVMSNGQIEQIGSSTEIYNHPATSFVATFVGENNVFEGRVSATESGMVVLDSEFGPLRARNPKSLAAGVPALLFIRPERFRIADRVAAGAPNVLEAQVADAVFEGVSLNILLRRKHAPPLTVSMSNDGAMPIPAPGATLRVAFAPDDAVVLPKGSRA
jgi:spermidine/putrescine transport system ATP-binding protein